MVRLAQTMHLYYVKISTICKQTKTSFHLSLVPYEYHRLHPKHFLAYGTFGANHPSILHRH
jgi:hypothetical protein